MEAALQELLDKKACEEVILRYGRTLDWLDADGQAECFWPDAQIDYGFFAGSGADWVPTVMAVEQDSVRRWHLATNVLVTVSGATARGECYGIAVGTLRSEDGQLNDTMFGGRYLDELEKRDGEWRIVKRKYVADWVQHFPNGLDALAESGLTLNVLDIAESGHPDYRPL